MAFRPTKPTFLFAFANDPAASLRLSEELDACFTALRQQEDRILCFPIGSASVETLYDQIDEFHDRLYLFHYGGHSDGGGLDLSDTALRAKSLATLLGHQQKLELVFLNGCSNAAQVETLWKAGVKAVIATSADVKDSKAMNLAGRFYKGLAAGKSIGVAFDDAAGFVMNNADFSIGRFSRGITLPNGEEDEFPWGLYLNENCDLDWDIGRIELANPFGSRTKYQHHLTLPPFRPDVFMGRWKELETIREKLFSGESLLLLVNGRGGVGKSSLASEYYHRYHNLYAHAAWVLSERSIAAAVLQLAMGLQMNFDPAARQAERLQALLLVLGNLDRPSLLVIDNANELEDLEENYGNLRRFGNLHVLLTSRIAEFRDIELVKVKGLPKTEAVDLFRKHYPKLKPKEEKMVHEVHQAVNSNTLVIELLAKSLRVANQNRERYTLDNLLKDLREKGLFKIEPLGQKVHLSYQSFTSATPEEVVGAMYVLGEGISQAERNVLSCLAVLPPESLPFGYLEILLAEVVDYEQSLRRLSALGWMEFNEEEATYKISPVVQEVIRHKNSEFLWNDCHRITEMLANELDSEKLHIDNYAHSSVMVRYAESIMKAFPEQPLPMGRLVQNIGIYYTQTGDLSKAMAAFEQMTEIYQGSDQNDPDNKNGLAISYSKLGQTQASLGHLGEALRYYELDAGLSKELYEAYPQNVSFKNGLAISYSKLGETQASLGHLGEALRYYEEETQLFEELYEAYPQNVSFKNGLAISYFKLAGLYSDHLNDCPKARLYYLNAQQLWNELVDQTPQYKEFSNNLSWVEKRLDDLDC